MSATAFEYTAPIVKRFPAARGAVVLVDGIDNSTTPSALLDDFNRSQHQAIERLRQRSIADHDSIRAWRAVFSALGVKPTQHRNAAEALLRRLDRHGDLPSINPAVDIGNMVSIRHALPVAVFDADRIDGTLRVGFARGDEIFHGIGAPSPDIPAVDEVIFIDDADTVAARRWCWKQDAATAATEATTRALFVIETAHDDAAALQSAEADLTDVVARTLGKRPAIVGGVSVAVRRVTLT